MFPSPAAWIVGNAQLYENSLGYHVLHPVGEGPDEYTVQLFDFGCESPVLGPDLISIENEVHSETFSNYTYDLEIHPEMIYSSSLVSFDNSNTMTGFSIGHVKFCTFVQTKYEGMDVTTLETDFNLAFDFTSNEFGTSDIGLEYPAQNISFPIDVTINNIISSTPDEYKDIVDAIEEVIYDYLLTLPLPNRMVSLVDVRSLNGAEKFAVDVGIDCICATESTCEILNGLAQRCLPVVSESLLNVLNNGEIEMKLNNKNDFPGLATVTIPTVAPPPTTIVELTEILQGSSSLRQQAFTTIPFVMENVLPPASPSEENLIIDITEQSIEIVFEDFDNGLPEGFDLHVEIAETIFQNNEMVNDVNFTISYDCSNATICDTIEKDIIPGISNDILVELQTAIDSGALTIEIQNLAESNNVSNLSQVVQTAGPISEISFSSLTQYSSSTISAALAVTQALPVAKALDNQATIYVEEVLNTVLTEFQNEDLLPGFELVIDVTDTSFENLNEFYDIEFRIMYPCTTDCLLVHNLVSPGLIQALEEILQNAVSDGSLLAALSDTSKVNSFTNFIAVEIDIRTITLEVPSFVTGVFNEVFPSQLEFVFEEDFSLEVCFCDDFTFYCKDRSPRVEENEVFSICLTPVDTSVMISNFYMDFTGNDGYMYDAIMEGDETYFPLPGTDVIRTHTVLVTSKLTSDFFAEDGTEVTVNGIARLRSRSDGGTVSKPYSLKIDIGPSLRPIRECGSIKCIVYWLIDLFPPELKDFFIMIVDLLPSNFPWFLLLLLILLVRCIRRLLFPWWWWW